MADPFMFQNYYGDRSLEQVANVFGTTFAESLFQLSPGAWQGPIESGLGWHLVWVDSLTPGRVPAFEEVEPSLVKSEWIADQRAEAKREAFEAMKARSEIVLPGAPAKEAAANGILRQCSQHLGPGEAAQPPVGSGSLCTAGRDLCDRNLGSVLVLRAPGKICHMSEEVAIAQ